MEARKDDNKNNIHDSELLDFDSTDSSDKSFESNIVKTIQKTGKTVDEAVNEALIELKTTKDKVEINILEHGSKGLFGIGSKPAMVSVSLIFDPERIARDFLREIFVAMNLSLEAEMKLNDKHLYINIKGENVGVLIGKRGQTLDALQYILNLVVNKGNGPYTGIHLDTENYRQKRKETLESLARSLAKKAKFTKRNVYLEPMTAYERRIIHSTLQGDRQVSTHSEGVEPNRYVVIISNKQ